MNEQKPEPRVDDHYDGYMNKAGFSCTRAEWEAEGELEPEPAIAEVVGFNKVGFGLLPIVSWARPPELGDKLYAAPKSGSGEAASAPQGETPEPPNVPDWINGQESAPDAWLIGWRAGYRAASAPQGGEPTATDRWAAELLGEDVARLVADPAYQAACRAPMAGRGKRTGAAPQGGAEPAAEVQASGLVAWLTTPLPPGTKLFQAAALAGAAPEPSKPLGQPAEALEQILRMAESDKRGWSDWDRVAAICRSAGAGAGAAPRGPSK